MDDTHVMMEEFGLASLSFEIAKYVLSRKKKIIPKTKLKNHNLTQRHNNP
jgi:hypothetical protein